MIVAEIQVLMGMTLEEAIILRDRLEEFDLTDPTTPYYVALDEQIRRVQKLAAA